MTPRVIGCFGSVRISASQCGLMEKPVSVIAAEPALDRFAHFGRVFHGVMHIDPAGPAIQLLLDELDALRIGNGRMTAAAVHVHDDAIGRVEEFLVLRPAVASHDGEDAVLLQQVDQDGRAGEEFVFGGTVALSSGDDEDAFAFEVGRRLDFESNLGLVVRIDLLGVVRADGGEGKDQQKQGEVADHGGNSIGDGIWDGFGEGNIWNAKGDSPADEGWADRFLLAFPDPPVLARVVADEPVAVLDPLPDDLPIQVLSDRYKSKVGS